FHRTHNTTRKCCTESDTSIANKLISGEKYSLYKCKNGLVDVAMPIIVGEHHVGNFYTGQFFLEKPDTEFFRNQARKYNFDETGYLSALSGCIVYAMELGTYRLPSRCNQYISIQIENSGNNPIDLCKAFA
ncbi:MAG TPA: PocR ligand-binding domain-containing protein, partial [Bacteroidales bacterium]|nr:PocR ligand-binding domain-containing protein [Bacteroidales bacterium]